MLCQILIIIERRWNQLYTLTLTVINTLILTVFDTQLWFVFRTSPPSHRPPMASIWTGPSRSTFSHGPLHPCQVWLILIVREPRSVKIYFSTLSKNNIRLAIAARFARQQSLDASEPWNGYPLPVAPRSSLGKSRVGVWCALRAHPCYEIIAAHIV